MDVKGQPTVSARKIPKQARSERTIELIFEATTRIIEGSGPAGLTTNAIAKKAGISIGSLYEYFPNKETILVAMMRRILADDERIMRDAIERALAKPGSDVVRETVRAFIGLYDIKPEVRRAIMRIHIMVGLAAEHTIPVRAISELIEARRADIFGQRPAPLSPTRAFVLVRAVVGVVRSVFNDGSPLLQTSEFEDELVTLIESYAAA